jgi:hypothetical protein
MKKRKEQERKEKKGTRKGRKIIPPSYGTDTRLSPQKSLQTVQPLKINQ